MPSSAVNRQPVDPAAWAEWIHDVAAAVGVSDADVSVQDLMELSSAVSSRFTRPMAPVSAFLWGYARALAPDADPRSLAAAILAAIPAREG